MPNLKDLRNRINSVKSTQKITAAMKMVAAAKFRRAQEQAEAGRPYADRMERMLCSLAESLEGREDVSRWLAGTGKDDVHLVVVATSDRGLCGSFNSSIVRDVRRLLRDLRADGKTIKILCVGRKGRDQLKREFGQFIVETIDEVGRPRLDFDDALRIAGRVRSMFEAGAFDLCTIVYNHFRSALTQVVTRRQLIPCPLPQADAAQGPQAVYEYEPSEEEILAELLPLNLAVQTYRMLLENTASEHGARMTAMDNATRNAGEMIEDLTLYYNRTRQAYITKELIEIISGAEAL